MIEQNNYINLYYLLFTLIPLSIILGPSISLLNISIFCLYYFFKDFKFNHLKYIFENKVLILLVLLNFYLILNVFISLDPNKSMLRNFGFFRFIIFFIAINYFFFKTRYDFSVFKIWLIIFFIFIFDVFFESFFGENLLGYGTLESPHGTRIVSFFKDEPIAGAFINGLLFLIFGYISFLIKKKNNFYKYFSLVIFVLLLTSVLVTGERSNTIKAVLGFLIFILFLDFFRINFKLFFFLIIISLMSLIISKSDFLKNRYVGQIYNNIINEDERDYFLENNVYFKLYKSGLLVFENYSLLGVGTKNYRVATCDQGKLIKEDYYCSTHPHQIYIEFLAEHGIIGSLISLSILFYLIFKNLGKIIQSKNYIQIGAFIYLLINFIPIIPSGSFFSDFNITFFMLNLSLMYAVNDKTNIFENKEIKSGPLAQ